MKDPGLAGAGLGAAGRMPLELDNMPRNLKDRPVLGGNGQETYCDSRARLSMAMSILTFRGCAIPIMWSDLVFLTKLCRAN